MGCSLSTGRESLLGDSSTVQTSQQNSAPGPRLAAEQLQTRHRASHSHLIISHHSSHRSSRHLEYESQREQEQKGLRLDQRVAQPLMMHIWTSRPQLTREEVMKRREEYYDTRVSGRVEIWDILRLAVETMENGDLPSAQEIINASGITIPTGNLIHGAYDELGTRYELPEYCVSIPRNMIISQPETEKCANGISDSGGEAENLTEIQKRRNSKGKQVIYENMKTYRVVARLSDRGGPKADISVTFGEGQPLTHIIREIMEKGKLGPAQKIKIAYLGKMLLEHQSLLSQGWVEGHIINALVLQSS